ncbi:hypothetical protein D210916BOD24_25960 [Alteromonas sp. D210916BOD_24]
MLMHLQEKSVPQRGTLVYTDSSLLHSHFTWDGMPKTTTYLNSILSPKQLDNPVNRILFSLIPLVEITVG